MIGLLANAVDPWDWTLWETPRLLVHVQVTVPPTATVSTAGFAVLLWALLNTIPPLYPTVTDPTGPPPPPPSPSRRVRDNSITCTMALSVTSAPFMYRCPNAHSATALLIVGTSGVCTAVLPW